MLVAVLLPLEDPDEVAVLVAVVEPEVNAVVDTDELCELVAELLLDVLADDEADVVAVDVPELVADEVTVDDLEEDPVVDPVADCVLDAVVEADVDSVELPELETDSLAVLVADVVVISHPSPRRPSCAWSVPVLMATTKASQLSSTRRFPAGLHFAVPTEPTKPETTY